MSLLQVTTRFAVGHALAGSGGAAFAAVSVADADGAPVSGLPESAFQFSAVANPVGCTEPMIQLLNGESCDGFYSFNVLPRPFTDTKQWRAGTYLVGVQVRASSDGGQAVGELRIADGQATIKKGKTSAPKAPVITTLDPDPFVKGSEGCLTITGKGFDTDSQVLIGRYTSNNPILVSQYELRAHYTNDMTAKGDVDVIVTTGTLSGSKTWHVKT